MHKAAFLLTCASRNLIMALIAKEKEQIVEKFKKSDNDTGSPEVQIALLTENINKLPEAI